LRTPGTVIGIDRSETGIPGTRPVLGTAWLRNAWGASFACSQGNGIQRRSRNPTRPGRGFSDRLAREGTPPHNPRPGASRLCEAVSLPEPLSAGNRRPETPPAARAPGAVGDEHRSNHRLARPSDRRPGVVAGIAHPRIARDIRWKTVEDGGAGPRNRGPASHQFPEIRPAPDASLERRSVSTPEPVPACFLCGDRRPDGEAIEPEAARSIERSGTRSDRSRREQLPPPHAQRWADRTFPETVSVLMVSASWPA